MKWLKDRNKFLSEAKIRDGLYKSQIKEFSNYWGEKYLDYEEVTPTDKIKQGKWKLEDEDKMKVLGAFFKCDMNEVFEIFNNLPDKFNDIIIQSIDFDIFTGTNKEMYETIFVDFNIKSPTIDQIVLLFDNVFRKLAVSETKASEMLQKDENGRPIKDEGGNMIKIQKEKGAPIFSNNLVNINSFLADYNRCFEDDKVGGDTFNTRSIQNLKSYASDHENDYTADFEIFNKDMYLQIDHNPKDILNMSISKFYSSCQHLYSGGYRRQLLGNVFDPNSIPAYLIFETPLFWGDDKISEFLPLTRMIVRNIESFDENDTKEPQIFFDRAYPDRMKDIFNEMVEKYSNNKQVPGYSDRHPDNYYYTPDIDMGDDLSEPYMDRINLKKIPYIGANTKTLYLNRNYDWSKVKIAPNAKIKELIIETTKIPVNMLDIKIELEWVKFKYLKIKTLENFENIKTDAIAFDKCKFDNSVLEDITNTNKNITKLQIISCDANDLNISLFENLEELHLVYTLDSLEELKTTLQNTNIKKLVLSGDLLSDKDSKMYINSLKSRMKVEIVGPVI
jgi:hypothetical protein